PSPLSTCVPDTATTPIYTLSLHDALPILHLERSRAGRPLLHDERCSRRDRLVQLHTDEQHAGARGQHLRGDGDQHRWHVGARALDRKSTRLNSSHVKISYAVFCLKKKTTR